MVLLYLTSVFWMAVNIYEGYHNNYTTHKRYIPRHGSCIVDMLILSIQKSRNVCLITLYKKKSRVKNSLHLWSEEISIVE